MKRSVRARPASAGPTASQAEAIAKIAPARAAAFEILTLVGAGKGHSDELLHSSRTEALSPEDRNLTTALVMGVLRWQIALDARVSKLLARPEQRLAEPVALVLRMGAFQLLHMDRIPAHAVLNESVEICRAAGQPHAAGMVNAVLRKLAAEKATIQKGNESKPTSQNRVVGHAVRGAPLIESPGAFAERLGHPLWLVERWAAAYGRAAALAICEYGQHEPGRGAIFVEADGDGADATAVGEDAPQMDDGSRLVAEIAAAAMPSVSDRVARVWDCCAAPGGKTLILAWRLEGAEILATDVSAKRLAQTAARLRRYAYAQRVRCAVMDASAAGEKLEIQLKTHLEDQRVVERDAEFDLILCDVPCSGTGTLARNPEIRHRLRVEDMARQAERQRAILSGALRRLAPGGRLVYSTCSLEPEENERVVEAVLPEAEVRRIPIGPLIAKLADAGVLRQDVAAGLIDSSVRDGALRMLPGAHDCDGFFAAVLQRA
jgi:16S rRNA (cytosine967-C5)-methyltransferase